MEHTLGQIDNKKWQIDAKKLHDGLILVSGDSMWEGDGARLYARDRTMYGHEDIYARVREAFGDG